MDNPNFYKFKRITRPTLYTPGTGDRFIPTRSILGEGNDSPLDWPTASEVNQASPFAKLLIYSLRNTTPELYAKNRILSFQIKTNPCQTFTRDRFNTLFSKGAFEIPSLCMNTSIPRKISIERQRLFDAPDVLQDFYSNVFTWTSSNLISIALGKPGDNGRIYNMDLTDRSIGSSSQINGQQAYAVSALGPNEVVSGWSDGAIRTHTIDTRAVNVPYSRVKMVSTSTIHATVTINSTTLMCGDSLGVLYHLDLRQPNAVTAIFNTGEEALQSNTVSGLAYNNDSYVASGGNNRKVKLWDLRKLTTPTVSAVSTYTDHKAAVKALAFKPGSGDYLVSGGGSACRSICLWHVPTGQKKQMIDTNAQVTGVHWFKDNPQYLLTSHGYTDCSVKVWRLTNNTLSLQHSMKISEDRNDRALCLAGSPTSNEFAVVTESETLRFFKPNGISAKELMKLHSNVCHPKSTLPPMLSTTMSLR